MEKMDLRYTLVLLLLLLCAGAHTEPERDFRFISYEDLELTADNFSGPGVSTFAQLLFDVSRNQVIVGVRDALYRLSIAHLDFLEAVEWRSPEKTASLCMFKGQTEENCHNYVKVLLTNGKQLLACGTNAFAPICSWREIDNLTMVIENPDGTAICPYNPNAHIAALLTDSGDICVGGPTDFSGSDYAIYRSGTPPIRTKQYNGMWLNEPQFVAAFETDRYYYFLFRETAVEFMNCGKKIYSRIARMCKNDKGGGADNQLLMLRDNWSTYVKARLNCSVAGEYPFHYDEIQSAVYVAGSRTLYATFGTPSNSPVAASALCAFDLAAIDAAFAGPFKHQDGSSSAWSRRSQSRQHRDHLECKRPTLNVSTILEISQYQLMDTAVAHRGAQHRPLFEVQQERLTHITVDVVATQHYGDQHVIYAANDAGLVRKLAVSPLTRNICVLEIWQTRKPSTVSDTGAGTNPDLEYDTDGDNGSVTDNLTGSDSDAILTMQYLRETNSVYVGTRQRLRRIPAAHCSRHASRDQCMNAMDPYCGWNSREGACTVAPHDAIMSTTPVGTSTLGTSVSSLYWEQAFGACPVLDAPVDGGWGAWSDWAPCLHHQYDSQVGGASGSTTATLYAQHHHHHHAHYHPLSGLNSSAQVMMETTTTDRCMCRLRKCDRPVARNGGRACVGIASAVTNCTVHGGWTPWSAWSACSSTCGTSMKTRTRTCSNPAPAHGGRVCVGVDRDEIVCIANPPCAPLLRRSRPQWSEWGAWESCSAHCGGGMRARRRTCNSSSRYSATGDYDGGAVVMVNDDEANTPENVEEGEDDGVVGCAGAPVQYEPCNLHRCKDQQTLWTKLVQSTNKIGEPIAVRSRVRCNANYTQEGGLKIRLHSIVEEVSKAPSPSDGFDDDGADQQADITWSSWSRWTECHPPSCDQVRMRYMLTGRHESKSGINQMHRRVPQIERRPCACDDDVSTDVLTDRWGGWSACSEPCGWGVQKRHRRCDSDKSDGCVSDEQRRPCQIKECEISYGWNEWEPWSACDNNNHQLRRHSCSLDQSDKCIGTETEVRICASKSPKKENMEIRSASVVLISTSIIGGYMFGLLTAIVGFLYYTRWSKLYVVTRRLPSSPHYMSAPPFGSKQNSYTPVPFRNGVNASSPPSASKAKHSAVSANVTGASSPKSGDTHSELLLPGAHNGNGTAHRIHSGNDTWLRAKDNNYCDSTAAMLAAQQHQRHHIPHQHGDACDLRNSDSDYYYAHEPITGTMRSVSKFDIDDGYGTNNKTTLGRKSNANSSIYDDAHLYN